MATYEVLFVGNGASASTDEQTVIDYIEAMSTHTWNVTYRAQSGSKDPSGYDVVVFPESGVFASNWSGTGDWWNVDVPMIVPANRVSSSDEAMSSSGTRGGNYTTGEVTADGEAHAIGVEEGWAENDTVTTHSSNSSAFRDAVDFGTGVDILLETTDGTPRALLAVGDTGDQSAGTDTFTNRRVAYDGLLDVDGSAAAEALVETCLMWLVGELDGGGAQTLTVNSSVTGTDAVGSPTVELGPQTLGVNSSVTGTDAVGSPTVELGPQTLSVNSSVTGLDTVGSPTVTQAGNNIIVGSSVTGIDSVGSPTVLVQKLLTINTSVTGTNAVGSPSVGQPPVEIEVLSSVVGLDVVNTPSVLTQQLLEVNSSLVAAGSIGNPAVTRPNIPTHPVNKVKRAPFAGGNKRYQRSWPR